jgi:hypothetical protein
MGRAAEDGYAKRQGPFVRCRGEAAVWEQSDGSSVQISVVSISSNLHSLVKPRR